MALKPMADNVIVKELKSEETTKGGIVLTSASKEKSQFAEVIAVGDGKMADGTQVSMNIEVGAHIIAAEYAGTKVKIDGEELTILKVSEILAIEE